MQVVKERSVIIQLHGPLWRTGTCLIMDTFFCWQEGNVLWQKEVQIDKLIGPSTIPRANLADSHHADQGARVCPVPTSPEFPEFLLPDFSEASCLFTSPFSSCNKS